MQKTETYDDAIAVHRRQCAEYTDLCLRAIEAGNPDMALLHAGKAGRCGQQIKLLQNARKAAEATQRATQRIGKIVEIQQG